MRACLHQWSVFSVRMVARYTGDDDGLTRSRLDALVDRGKLRRWHQWGPNLPDVYYRAPD